MTSNVKG